MGTVFTLLLVAIAAQRDAAAQARNGLQVLLASDELGLLIVDLERGERGFIITDDEAFLAPWLAARVAFPSTSESFQHLANGSGDNQAAHARKIIRMTASYIRDYSVPLVNTARTDLPTARSERVTAQGSLLIHNLRRELAGFRQEERKLLAGRQDAANDDATLATAAAAAGLGVSIVLVLLSGGYLARRVVRPVRDAAGMADRVAGGDLAVRMPGTAQGEVGVLQRALNAMAGSLQDSQSQLQRAANEQAALRRVATLVASGAPPPEVFAAIAAETGEVLGAAATVVARYEADDTVATVGTWAASPGTGAVPELGSRWPVEEVNIPAQVRRTRQGARQEYRQAADRLGAWARQRGFQSGVGSPVFVEGRLWGVVIAFAGAGGLRSAAVQARMQAFTELAAMAVANSESLEQLAASRARIVAAADESRRRVERDLHDGTQQRLISLMLNMRATAGRIPPDQAELREQWDQTAQHLAEVTEDLREVTRGLHPPILATGGLGPALRGLARRSAVPVELNVGVRERLPEQVQITAYYFVSEALNNAAKHAQASRVQVEAKRSGNCLAVLVRDDGRGGADPSRGSGLLGLRDRAEAVGGRIEIVSPPGEGTSLLVTIPVSTWQTTAAPTR